MRPFALAFALVATLTVLAASAGAGPERAETGTVLRAGFSKKQEGGTLLATQPRGRETSTVFATVKVSASVGAD